MATLTAALQRQNASVKKDQPGAIARRADFIAEIFFVA